MATIHLRLLLLLFSLISLSSAATTTPPPPSLSQTLSSLGFHDLAAASAAAPPSAWHGPITVFVPTASSLSTCPSCSLSLLLQEHTLPGLFPLPYLRSLLSGTRIETLAPGRCLSVTHSLSKVFLSGVELTHPNLLSNPLIIVHVIQGYVTPLSPASCSLERMTSLSFLPSPNQGPPRGTLPPPSPSPIMRLMLKDAILRLRLSGYTILSIALRLKAAELADLQSFTVFALDDVAIFSPGGHAYVTDFRFHMVPNKLLLAGDLDRLAPGTVLPTMEEGKELVVTASGGGIGGAPARVNYVKVTSPDLLFNLKIAVHGVKMPFPHVNLTAAIGMSKNERSRYSDGNEAVVGDAGVGYSVAPTGNEIKWTAEIEDHHGL